MNIQRVALRKLAQLDAVYELRQLGVPPGNKLEALKKERAGQHSIRINDQWRVCFVWRGRDVYDVEITDYHWQTRVRIPRDLPTVTTSYKNQ